MWQFLFDLSKKKNKCVNLQVSYTSSFKLSSVSSWSKQEQKINNIKRHFELKIFKFLKKECEGIL